ncbi:hypothetical protein COCMIDRAFT_3617 [Bipolaris oryzae ATCC 44560]|uniref:Uncharacterized protein n=1 Tax=Bipolaris oryzae ATCC 44560 TaxID=930090 RepID=W6ZC30_COCMI|nr:uncharacterized protein COCMIDRAFT_3617 [Bipolaris oryzae ATCC 44560]EUC47358.1 hypothetical protein COCMIDRAFT_3617 [Bipolaris oryzae ATCC 44560]
MCEHMMQTPHDQCSICIEENNITTFEDSAPIQKIEKKAEISFNNSRAVPEEEEDFHDQRSNCRDYKALSDVDSITSHWRLDDLEEELEPMPPAWSSTLQTETTHEENLLPLWTQGAPYNTYENGVSPSTVLYNPNHREGSYTGRYNHHRSSSPYIPWTAHPYFSPPSRNPPINTSSSRAAPSTARENTLYPYFAPLPHNPPVNALSSRDVTSTAQENMPVGDQSAFPTESLSGASHREIIHEQLAQLPHHMAQARLHHYQPQPHYYGEPPRNYLVWPGERTYGVGVPPHLWPVLWPDVNRPFRPGAFDHLRSQMGHDEPKSK